MVSVSETRIAPLSYIDLLPLSWNMRAKQIPHTGRTNLVLGSAETLTVAFPEFSLHDGKCCLRYWYHQAVKLRTHQSASVYEMFQKSNGSIITEILCFVWFEKYRSSLAPLDGCKGMIDFWWSLNVELNIVLWWRTAVNIASYYFTRNLNHVLPWLIEKGGQFQYELEMNKC